MDWLRPHTLNLYEYCANDPVNNRDPTGFADEQNTDQIIQPVDLMNMTEEEQYAFWEDYYKALQAGGEFVVEIVADTYGDAFELVTGTTITGDPGNRGMATVAIMVPFASSAGVGNLVEVAMMLGERAPLKAQL